MAAALNRLATRRVAALVLLTLVLDPPIVDRLRFAAWMAGLLVLCAAPTPGWRRLGWAALVCVTVLLGRQFLPALHIEEAHHYFRPDAAQPLRDWLPPPVFAALDQQFKERYPPEYWCEPQTSGCWRAAGPVLQPYAFSPEGAFRKRDYSRVVDTIAFEGLGELRAGFTNRVETNWWDRTSDVRRRDMPFYVMYVLPAEAAGSVLCWRGDVFWEQAGQLQDVRSTSETCRPIQASDAGQRVFAISVLHQPLSLRLQLSPALARAASARQGMAVIGAIAVVLLAAFPLPRTLIVSLVLGALGALAIGPETLASFRRYDPLGGGSDGIPYESYAHSILESAERGDLAGALKGVEPSFFFMPGLRYFRALEKVVFGETYLGYLAMLLVLPAILLRFLRVFLPVGLAIVLWLAFFLPLPVADRFWWSLRSYVDLARAGLAEPLAHVLFLAGLVLLLSDADDPGRWKRLPWGSFVLSLACLVRPNLLIATTLVLLFVTFRLARAGGSREARLMWLAFTPFLWIPLHNLIYAGRFELAARVIGPATLTPPDVYVHAFRDLLRGDSGGASWQRVVTQLGLWIQSPARAVTLVLGLALLVLPRVPLVPRALGLAVLGLHPMLLFWAPQGRYAHLAWQVTLVAAATTSVFVVSLAWAHARPRVPPRLERVVGGAFSPRSIAVTVAGVVVALAVAEVALRLTGPRHHEAAPATTGDRAHFFVRPNSLGFRGPEPGTRADCLTLVTVGSSTTESPRLPDAESWPGRLESELSRNFRCVQVINAGRESFSTFGQRRLLADLVLKLEPDTVLILPGLEDIGRERATTAELAPLWPRWLGHVLIRHSALASALLAPKPERRNVAYTRLDAELAGPPGAAADRRHAQLLQVRHRQIYVPAYRVRLEAMIRLARQRNVQPILLTQPALYGESVDPDTGVDLRSVSVNAAERIHGGLAWRILDQYNEATREIGREHAVQVIDLASTLPKRSAVYEDLVHLNSRGAGKAAEIVARELCRGIAARRQQHLYRPCGPPQ